MNIRDEQWRIGRHLTTVVSNTPVPNGDIRGHNDVEGYGGYLVAESICGAYQACLIAAAPDLYRACKELSQKMGAIMDSLNRGELSPLDLSETLRKTIDLSRIHYAVGKAEGWFIS